MQQASCLEGGPLLWIWPLYLHVNKKSDDDDDDDFSVEKNTPKFTYRLLKSSVYIINQIRDLTNSYDMPRSRSQWLFLEKTLSLL